METQKEIGAEIKPIYIPFEKVTYIVLIYSFLKMFIEILTTLNKIRTTCIVGYDDSLIFMMNENFNPKNDPLFSFFRKTVLFSPKFFSSIEEASTKFEKCKSLSENLFQNEIMIESARPCILHNNFHLKIWRPWDFRNMKNILRWRKTRKVLEKSNKRYNKMLFSAGLENWKHNLE